MRKTARASLLLGLWGLGLAFLFGASDGHKGGGAVNIFSVLATSNEGDARMSQVATVDPDTLQDPNPFIGDEASLIGWGVFSPADTFSTDHIHCISNFNYGGCSSTFTPSNDIFSSKLQMEYTYGQGARSGNYLIEWNWDITPGNHIIADYNSDVDATAGTVALGDTLTYTGGEQCRVISVGLVDTLTNASITCLDGDAPEDNDAITGCTGTCTGPPDGTVNGTPTSERTQWRPFSYHWNAGTGQTALQLRATRTEVYFAGSAFRANLGWDGATAGNTMPRMPVNAAGGGGGFEGDFYFDNTADQWVGGDGANMRVYGQYQRQACFRVDNMDAAVDDNAGGFFAEQPITILGIGCNNFVATASATDATIPANGLEDGAGNAMTHAGVTCSDRNATVTFVPVTANNTLISGETVRYDVGVSSTAPTDDHIICLTYMMTRQ